MITYLEKKISEKLNKHIRLTITDNKSTIVSIKKTNISLTLRLHHMFLNAKETVINDLVAYIQNGKTKALNHFINKNTNKIRKLSRKTNNFKLHHNGDKYNLNELYNEINQNYFDNQINCQITWSKTNKERNKRSIRFGSYYSGHNLIRIHKALDQECVPEFFIQYIVYHEMLHVKIKRTIKRIHTKEFKEAEKQFRFYQEAIAWEKENLHYFLRIKKRNKKPQTSILSQPTKQFWAQSCFPF